MPRPAIRKKGAYTRAEIQRRYRQRKKRELPDPKTVKKQQRRAERERATGEKIAAMVLPTKQYGVIIEDPEWRDEVWSRETGLDRAPDNHYATTAAAGIIARDEVVKLAARRLRAVPVVDHPACSDRPRGDQGARVHLRLAGDLEEAVDRHGALGAVVA